MPAKIITIASVESLRGLLFAGTHLNPVYRIAVFNPHKKKLIRMNESVQISYAKKAMIRTFGLSYDQILSSNDCSINQGLQTLECRRKKFDLEYYIASSMTSVIWLIPLVSQGIPLPCSSSRMLALLKARNFKQYKWIRFFPSYLQAKQPSKNLCSCKIAKINANKVNHRFLLKRNIRMRKDKEL